MAEGITLATTSDTEMIAALIANDPAPLEDAVANAMARLDGAYSVVMLSEGKLIGFRDKHGFRPLCLGRGETASGSSPRRRARSTSSAPSWSARSRRASWSRSTRPAAQRARPSSPPPHSALCIFEFFYLARPDTRLDGVEVHGARLRMGERLAREAPVEADLVLPIPDSGTPAAIGFSRATGIPFSEGLIKNRYVAARSSSPTRSCASRA